MVTEEKIIMYDSPEAAVYKTGLEGWVSSTGRFWGKDEHMARWEGCTHTTCPCGKIIKNRTYTICEDCRHKKASERYNSMPFREYMGEPVVTWDGDTYFFEEDDLAFYCEENELTEIDLLFCEPIMWSDVKEDYWGDDMPENVDEIPEELQKALDNLNKVVKSLPPCSYEPGKIRTKYTYTPD